MPYGIPTTYAGTNFRSRLEARWAAFHTLLHIPHVYEPFDLAGYIPDFLVSGEVLAEVKPACNVDDLRSAWAGIRGRLGAWNRSVVILGVSPEAVGLVHPTVNPEDIWTDVLFSWIPPSARAALWAEAGNLTQWRP